MSLIRRLLTKLAAASFIFFGFVGLLLELREGEGRDDIVFGFALWTIFLAYGVALCVLIVRRRDELAMIFAFAAIAYCLICVAGQWENQLRYQRFHAKGIALIAISGLTAGFLLLRARPEPDQR